jgi:hypothetical protein
MQKPSIRCLCQKQVLAFELTCRNLTVFETNSFFKTYNLFCNETSCLHQCMNCILLTIIVLDSLPHQLSAYGEFSTANGHSCSTFRSKPIAQCLLNNNSHHCLVLIKRDDVPCKTVFNSNTAIVFSTH